VLEAMSTSSFARRLPAFRSCRRGEDLVAIIIPIEQGHVISRE
jgi:hypothetical protein